MPGAAWSRLVVSCPCGLPHDSLAEGRTCPESIEQAYGHKMITPARGVSFNRLATAVSPVLGGSCAEGLTSSGSGIAYQLAVHPPTMTMS